MTRIGAPILLVINPFLYLYIGDVQVFGNLVY